MRGPHADRNEIAAKVGCNPATVSKWRKRFAESRLDGLIDEPRPGAQRTIGDDVVEQVVIDTLETTPKDATHWSTPSMAERHGISRQTEVAPPGRTRWLRRSRYRVLSGRAVALGNLVSVDSV